MPRPASRVRLPLGVQTFRTLRRGNYYYVDKTHFAVRLKEEGSHYFLSRPRRFGKSLFLSTLKELFEGNRELFHGLAAYDQWDWSVRRPVAHLAFGGGLYTEAGGLHDNLLKQLSSLSRSHGAQLDAVRGPDRFAQLLEELHRLFGRRVVVLVDEYDKPITENLNRPDLARANRDYLRALYANIKDCEEHIRFSFLTGVTKFSKVSLFSGVNNLIDLTLEAPFSSLCGYTERDLNTVFGPELKGLDREEIRAWYNGYSWGGEEKVYNPYDLLLTLRTRDCKAWWFQTGTPKWLIELVAAADFPWHRLEGMLASDELLSTLDVDEVVPHALLFQSGCLTVRGVERIEGRLRYRLGFPNRKVRECLNRALLKRLTRWPQFEVQRLDDEAAWRRILRAGDMDRMRRRFKALLASIPKDWHVKSEMGKYEGYYKSVLYGHLSTLGQVQAEQAGSRGRADFCLEGCGWVYVFEFKMRGRGGARQALRQIREKGYAERYAGGRWPIRLVGLQLSPETHELTEFEWEDY